MKREALEKLGLSKEVIDQVMAMHGETLNATKTDLQTITAQRDNYKKASDEANAKIAEFQKLDVDTIKKQASEWESKYKEKETEYTKQITGIKRDYAIEREIAKLKVRNPTTVKKLLEIDKIQFDGEKLMGIEEQIKGLKESDPYLFEEVQQQKFGGENNLPNSGATLSALDRKMYEVANLDPDGPKTKK